MAKIFWVLTFIILSHQVSWAATDCSTQVCRYVRAGASGNGTDWNNAYGSLPTTLTRGAVYFIAGGSYPSYEFNTAASGTTLITVKKATIDDHGTETGWVSSYGTAQAAFPGFGFTTSHWLVDGVTGGGPGSWTSGFGFRINQTSGTGIDVLSKSGNVTNITIRHFEVVGIRDQINAPAGLDINNEGTSTLSNLTLSYFYMDQIGGCPFLLAPGNSADNLIFEYGYIGVFGDLSNKNHTEIASIWAGAKNLHFRYNIFTHSWGTGGLIFDGNGLNIYGNVFYKRPGSAAWGFPNGLIGTWTSSTATNVKVYNNSFVDIPPSDGGGSVFGGTFTAPTTGNEIKNNLFVNVSALVGGDSALFPTRSHNHFVSTSSFGTNATTSTADPFVDKLNLDFRLNAALPTGLSLASPFNVDLSQLTRGADGVWDRGAAEFSSDGTTPTPTATPVPTPTPVPTATPTPTATPVPTATPAIIGETLLGASAPDSIDANDGVSYELGMKFSSVAAGQVTAIRFYKSPSETGTHTGKIYSSNGTLLASVAFANETASGWQIAYLASPLAIAANTTYTVSVNTGANFYASTTGDFSAAKTSGNLRAPISAGVYGAVGAMPATSWSGSNYFRDVVFVPSSSATPTPTPVPTATPTPTATPVPTATPAPTDSVKPTAAITSPADGSRVTRSSTVTIAASASDNVAVTKVEFYVNGTLKCTDTSAPHTCSWSVPSARGVPYALQVKAYDAVGNVGPSATVTVTSR